MNGGPRRGQRPTLGAAGAAAASANGFTSTSSRPLFDQHHKCVRKRNSNIFAEHRSRLFVMPPCPKRPKQSQRQTLPIAHSFVSLAFFYTNLLEYYVPQMEGDTLLMPIYLPGDFRAPFVDPMTATGPAVLSVLSDLETFKGKTLPIVGDIISPREMVETFQHVTGIKAEYRSAFKREELLKYFPAFGANELLVDELIGMVEFAVEYGYFDKEHDLEWSRLLNPETLSWEQFLKSSDWRGDRKQFGL
ncbi:NmrA family NAD(P)-binding protein [Rhizobium leguminosarum]|uniref:NmrA family NAD(P)-binding protein n=1 Tax=Rhizobium leguminosarum TaxID=384 RepID=UPI0021BC11F5|nr:NmrA family NAD(P)-binding protein [Rhizobium leguminosarum]